jgi:hypothetical protein
MLNLISTYVTPKRRPPSILTHYYRPLCFPISCSSPAVGLEEPVHQPSTRCHKHTEPPPLIGPRASLSALEQDLMREVALHFAGARCCSNERVERRGGEHLWGVGVDLVERHEGRAVGLIEIEALALVVAIDGDGVLLLCNVSDIPS